MNTIFLYVIITLNTGGQPLVTSYEMENLDICLAAVSAAKLGVPNGGDAETSVSMFCAGKFVESTTWSELRLRGTK